MAIKFSKSLGARVDGGHHNGVIAALIAGLARSVTAAAADLTDSTGGTASTTKTLVAIPTTYTNIAASGSNLADKTTAEAALTAVKDAILELATKANALATSIGVDTITYNGGGTTADGTVGAIAATVTGATTGVQAASITTTVAALKVGLASVAVLVNNLAHATGVSSVDVAAVVDASLTTVPAITIAGGTAAAPGVAKTAMDATLLAFQTNVATLVAAITTMTTAFVPDLVVVR